MGFGTPGRAPGLCRGVGTGRLGRTQPCQHPLDRLQELCSRLNFSKSLQTEVCAPWSEVSLEKLLGDGLALVRTSEGTGSCHVPGWAWNIRWLSRSGTMILSRAVLNGNYSGFGLNVKLAEKRFVNMQHSLLFVPFQTVLEMGFSFLLSRVCVWNRL